MEFVDDYERPVLEKYEKVTPTPMAKKGKVSETAKVLYTITVFRNNEHFTSHRLNALLYMNIFYIIIILYYIIYFSSESNFFIGKNTTFSKHIQLKIFTLTY